MDEKGAQCRGNPASPNHIVYTARAKAELDQTRLEAGGTRSVLSPSTRSFNSNPYQAHSTHRSNAYCSLRLNTKLRADRNNKS